MATLSSLKYVRSEWGLFHMSLAIQYSCSLRCKEQVLKDNGPVRVRVKKSTFACAMAPSLTCV